MSVSLRLVTLKKIAIENNEVRAIQIEQEIALFRADLATSSPQSYTIDEMKQISSDVEAKTKALDDAIRADFES